MEGIDVLCLQEFLIYYFKNYFIDYFRNEVGFKYVYVIFNGVLVIFSCYFIEEIYMYYFVKYFNGF